MQKKIVVFDYSGILKGNGTAPWHIARYLKDHGRDDPEIIEANAWCVQGETGFLAFFFHEDHFCIATGDDGHWYVIDVMDKHWVKEVKDVMEMVEECPPN